MRCACIDIGSNTTRLLVADSEGGGIKPLAEDREFTRLRGEGPVPPEKIDHVVVAVQRQMQLALSHGCARLRVVGTAALRDAANREEILKAIAYNAGVPVEILSGDEEAELAFAGATRTLPESPGGTIGVVDVGGGSTELVVGSLARGVQWSVSLKVGSGVLADRHLRTDPPTAEELDAVRESVKATFAGIDAPLPDQAIAVGGSAGSLRLIVGDTLDQQALDHAVELLTAEPAAEIAQRYGLAPERVAVLPAGLCVLAEASAALEQPLTVGRGGLREGVVLAEPKRAEREAREAAA